MSSLGKIRKNVDRYRMEQFCNQMTPEQYKQALKTAVKAATENLALEYDRRLIALEKVKDDELSAIINVISVELLYEIAVQMDCFAENPEYLDQKREKIQEMFENTMNSIQSYISCKQSGVSLKQFHEKREKIEKTLNIKF